MQGRNKQRFRYFLLFHGRNVRNVDAHPHLPRGNRRCRGFVDFLDLDDDELLDGEGRAELAGERPP